MALATFNFLSIALSKMVAVNVIIPETFPGKLPVLYLLHGLTDDYTVWLRRSRIEWYVKDTPLIVVMPDGGRGFYTNNDEGPAWATFIAEELPRFIERMLPAREDRAGRFISGLSMGGYGAMRLALGYPDRFASAVSHSGSLQVWNYRPEITSLGPDEHRRIFGPHADGTQHDLLHLAAMAKSTGNLPRLKIDCGVDDFLLSSSRAFRDGLAKMNIDFRYDEFAGAHTWDYWDAHVREGIEFHLS